MLIDWLTLKLTRESCPDWGGWKQLERWGDRVLRVCARTGAIVWETTAWDSVRSDSHQLAVVASAHSLRIQGSPARVMGDGDTVFGVGVAGRDVYACAAAMIGFIGRRLCLATIPHVRLWSCSRMDVTANYALPRVSDVRVALTELRNIEGGRYRVSQTAGDTVYWSHLSAHRAGKAYAKGAHLRYLLQQHTYAGRRYSDSELTLADKLLREELRLGRKYFLELRKLKVAWYSLKWPHWFGEFENYFGRMLGTVEVVDMASILDRLLQLPNPKEPGQFLSEGRAKAVYRTWMSISTIGWQATRELMPPRTWYDHLGFLRQIGLGDADISAGRVISLRRPLVLTPVTSWEELRMAA